MFKQNKGLYFGMFVNLLIVIMIFPAFVFAQEVETITGEGILYSVEGYNLTSISMTFPPEGGKVSGNAYWQGDYFGDDGCTSHWRLDFTGYFQVEMMEISGTVVFDGVWCIAPEDEWYDDSGTWSGYLFNDGTGEGTILLAGDVSKWEISFPAGVFDFEKVPVEAPEDENKPVEEEMPIEIVVPEAEDVEISHEYIYTTYGINVWDSFGDDGYARAVWSPQELAWLNDVLKELPPELMDRMAVNRIVRNTVYIDEDGNPDPDTSGIFEPCDQSVDPHCDGSSATIRIFDEANSQFDFLNDPDGEKQFKATIVHEMVHGMQYYKGRHETYNDSYSPLVENYIDATRQITDMDDPGFNSWNGWNWDGQRWRYTNDSSNQPPTSYGLTNPLEDMAESVMMYVYDPERLKNSSYERYYFIRDEMFGGVEYEDGVQKNP